MERKCIVCGNDNPRPRSKFCSEKCLQKYCYEIKKQERKEYKKEYYQKNKEEYIERATNWQKENRERWNVFQNNYQKLMRKKAKEEANENE